MHVIGWPAIRCLQFVSKLIEFQSNEQFTCTCDDGKHSDKRSFYANANVCFPISTFFVTESCVFILILHISRSAGRTTYVRHTTNGTICYIPHICSIDGLAAWFVLCVPLQCLAVRVIVPAVKRMYFTHYAFSFLVCDRSRMIPSILNYISQPNMSFTFTFLASVSKRFLSHPTKCYQMVEQTMRVPIKQTFFYEIETFGLGMNESPANTRRIFTPIFVSFFLHWKFYSRKQKLKFKY